MELLNILCLPQDAVLLQFNEGWYKKNRLVAWAREKLKIQGIVGLHEAPCLRGLLERLPQMLQEQYHHEKVSSSSTLYLK